MNITVHLPDCPKIRGYQLSHLGIFLNNSNGIFFKSDFNATELRFLLGSKNFDNIRKGQFQFNVEDWKVKAVTGQLNSLSIEHLKFEFEYFTITPN